MECCVYFYDSENIDPFTYVVLSSRFPIHAGNTETRGEMSRSCWLGEKVKENLHSLSVQSSRILVD